VRIAGAEAPPPGIHVNGDDSPGIPVEYDGWNDACDRVVIVRPNHLVYALVRACGVEWHVARDRLHRGAEPDIPELIPDPIMRRSPENPRYRHRCLDETGHAYRRHGRQDETGHDHQCPARTLRRPAELHRHDNDNEWASAVYSQAYLPTKYFVVASAFRDADTALSTQ